MLVLTRREGDKICIGSNIVITVALIRGSKVRIGIEAPKDVSVMRAEVLARGKKKSPDEREDSSRTELVST